MYTAFVISAIARITGDSRLEVDEAASPTFLTWVAILERKMVKIWKRLASLFIERRRQPVERRAAPHIVRRRVLDEQLRRVKTRLDGPR